MAENREPRSEKAHTRGQISGGPIRTCAACRVEAPQELLQRLTMMNGQLQVDQDVKAPGRGVYVHPEHDLSDTKTRDKVIRSVSRRSK